MAPTKSVVKKSATLAKPQKFVIDFTGPANDKIFDAAAYEKFLVEKIKVEGKTGQLGESVTIAREGSGKLAVTSTIPFSKRYLKYLTKKFLKKNQMREWLRVVSTDKNTYALKFYNVEFGAEGDEE